MQLTRRELFRRFLPSPDNAIEYGAEGLLVLVALNEAFRAQQDHIYSLEITPNETTSDIPGLLESQQALFYELYVGVPESVSNQSFLQDTWRAAYYKSKIEQYIENETHCSGSGDKQVCQTVPVLKQRTVWYWEEPTPLTSLGIDRNSLDQWANTLRALQERIVHLSDRIGDVPVFKHADESYSYTAEPIPQDTFTLGRFVGFGASAVGFAFYEEILAALGNTDSRFSLLQGIDEKHIKRRAFLKGAFGLLALHLIGDYREAFALSTQTIDEDARSFTQRILEERELSPEGSFTRYFGMDIPSLFQFLDTISQKVSAGLQIGTTAIEDWDVIAPRLQAIQGSIQSVRDNLARFFSLQPDGSSQIPGDLVQAMQNVWTDDQVRSYQGAKNFEANREVLEEIVRFAGTLLGISIGAEIVTQVSATVQQRYIPSTMS